MTTLSRLKDLIDSDGKKVPSAMPDDRISYDSGAGLTSGEAPSALAEASEMPPPLRIFMPARSATLVTGFFARNIWPGPWVKTPSSFTPLYSLAACRYFQWMRENATELISAVAPAPGSSASSGSGWRAGV